MNCRQARKGMVDLLDLAPDPDFEADILSHLEGCPACAHEYETLRETWEMLQPANHVSASPGFKERLMENVQETNRSNVHALPSRPIRRRLIRPVLAAGLAVILLITASFGFWYAQNGGVQSSAAFSVLGQAVHAMDNLNSVHIAARMRTVPRDNFQLIRLDLDFVPIDLWKQFSDPPQWRVETSGRVLASDGNLARMLIKTANMASERPARRGGPGWLAPLMDVNRILENERTLARKQGSLLTLEHGVGPDGADELLVYVEAVAQGDYTNDYLLNKSISGSDNLRVYRLDADTLYLKGLQVYVHADEGDILVFETTSVEYDLDMDAALFTVDFPEDVSWFQDTPVTVANEADYAALAPEEMARAFFEACGREDWEEVEKFYPASPVPTWLTEGFAGLEVLRIGEPFKSGRYPGWFVPYEIRFRNGGTKKFNLAVRNDNRARRYMVDGGL